MHPRHATRSAFVIAAILLVLGAAAATTSLTVTVGRDGASVHAETDDVPRLPPRESEPPRPQPNNSTTFTVGVSPAYQNGTAGDTLHYTVFVHAKRDVVVHLQAFAPYDFRATLSESDVAVRAGSNASVKLALDTPPYDALGEFWINATAHDTGENHVAGGQAEVRAPPPPPAAKLRVRFDRDVANISAGANTSFTAYVESTQNRTIRLSIGNISQGYRASLSPDEIFSGPSWTGTSTLFVWASPNATADGIVEVIAWSDQGETARARVYLRLASAGPGPTPNATAEEGAADAPASAPAMPTPEAAPLLRVEILGADFLVESGARATFPMP